MHVAPTEKRILKYCISVGQMVCYGFRPSLCLSEIPPFLSSMTAQLIGASVTLQ
jgi:hypothetical protein